MFCLSGSVQFAFECPALCHGRLSRCERTVLFDGIARFVDVVGSAKSSCTLAQWSGKAQSLPLEVCTQLSMLGHNLNDSNQAL